MLTLRRHDERGHANHGWLDTHHTFSFAHYYDPAHMGFSALRVINEDRVAPGAGFGTHPHRDMEIISYVLGGALEHRDSMGTGSVIRPGEIQYMSAGTGVRHSEFNGSRRDPLHFLQIWIMPNERGQTPRYDQRELPRESRLNKLALAVSPDGSDDTIAIRQDARIFTSILESGATVEHTVPEGRGAWIHVARGRVKVDDHELRAGDGASTRDAGTLVLEGLDHDDEAEVLVFDLP